MRPLSRTLRLGALLLASLLLTARDARACSICLAGDPSYSMQGASAQAPGELSTYLELRGWRKTSGLLPGEHEHGEEENESQRLDLYLSWTPLDRLTLTLDLPWVFNEITEEEEEERITSTLSGFGDASLSGSVVLWRDRPALPTTWLEGRAFLKLPTGASSQEVDGREDPHLQVGTGSWDWGFGLAATHRLTWGSLYASAFGRENRQGSLAYEYGKVWLANAAVDVAPGHVFGQPALDPFTLGLELNFRYAGRDEFEDQTYEDSGGAILFITPSLRVRLPQLGDTRLPVLRLAVQLPATQSWLHDEQHEDAVWSAGLQYTF